MKHKKAEVVITWHKHDSRSHQLALAIQKWLSSSQLIAPWISDDIEPGDMWLNKLLEKMKTACYQVACITDGCGESTWIAFEAGYVVGRLDGSVTGFYVDDEDALPQKSPLRHLQATRATRADCSKLWLAIHKARLRALSEPEPEPGSKEEKRLLDRFSKSWPAFEKSLAELHHPSSIGANPVPGTHSARGHSPTIRVTPAESAAKIATSDIESRILAAMHDDTNHEFQYLSGTGIVSNGKLIVGERGDADAQRLQDILDSMQTERMITESQGDGCYRLS